MNCGLDYVSFKTQLFQCVSERCGEGTQVLQRKVVKNNSFELDCIVIFGKTSVASPNFYIQKYFQKYMEGECIEDIVEEILEEYKDSHADTHSVDLRFDSIHDRIVFRLVSFDKNRKLLKTVPYIPFLDLAITFHCLMMQTGEGIGSIRITNEMIEQWDLGTEELYQLAKQNTKSLFPKRICTLAQIMDEVSEITFDEQFFDGEIEMMESIKEDEHYMPYVLTNSNGINGAAAMLYPECLKEIGIMMEGDFFILPSSIHEVLILSANSMLCEDELEQLVQDVNQSYVMPEEMLSDRVYRYYVSTGTVKICNNSYPVAS